MRKLIYGLVALATIGLLATSCKKEETYSFAVPSGSILVSMPGEEGTTSFDSFNIASIGVSSTPQLTYQRHRLRRASVEILS